MNQPQKKLNERINNQTIRCLKTYDDGIAVRGVYEMGNCYPTLAHAQRAKARTLAIVKINKLIEEINAGWQWQSGEYLTIHYSPTCKNGMKFGVIVLDSDVQSVFIKTCNCGILDVILNDFEADLKLIFGVTNG